MSGPEAVWNGDKFVGWKPVARTATKAPKKNETILIAVVFAVAFLGFAMVVIPLCSYVYDRVQHPQHYYQDNWFDRLFIRERYTPPVESEVDALRRQMNRSIEQFNADQRYERQASQERLDRAVDDANRRSYFGR